MKKSKTRWLLVTGAAGGMGKAGVAELRRRGFGVFALDLYPGLESREEILFALGATDDELIVPIKASVTDGEMLASVAEHIGEITDRLYGIIHFAGIYMLDSLVEMEDEAFRRIFDVNVRGAYLVNKTFMRYLARGSRIIIVTSELAVLDPLPFTGIYGVTKAALDKYAYSLRMELQLLGISVSVLRAGAVDTGMLGTSMAALERFVEKTKLYTCNAKKFKAIVEKVEARSIPTDKLARKISRIARKRRPRFAYAINRNPLLLLLGILPKRVQLFAIRKILKTKREKGNG